MQNHWLSTTNFEQSHDLILAVTTLSLYYKTHIYEIKGVDFSDEELQLAVKKVNLFLEQITRTLKTIEVNADHLVIGVSPQFGDMILQYRNKRQTRSPKPHFYEVSLDYVMSTLQSLTPSNFEEALEFLEELRQLVDRNFTTDTNNLFGEI